MGILVIALSINPRPLSALELKLSGLIMESRVDTAGDNQNAHVIISKYYSQIFGGISAMQWRKAERYRRFQQHVFRLLCVRIEIGQLKCVNC